MAHIGNRFSQHSFAQVPQANIARSNFDRSFGAKDTFDFDYLVPIFIDEILPGDTCNLNVQSFIRLASQEVPVMDNMKVDFEFFFVPNRLVWDNFEKQMGEQENPGDTTDYLTPYIESPAVTGFEVGSLYDHLGIPTGVPKLRVNALPLRGIYRIINEWYRDQNLQNSLVFNKGDGPDSPSAYVMWKRAKKHDYFTSGLPFLQKGAAITLPLGTSAPVYGHQVVNHRGNQWQAYDVVAGVHKTGWIDVSSDSNSRTVFAEATTWGTSPNTSRGFSLGTKAQYVSPSDGAPPYADLTQATAATINQFRMAIMMQSLLELDARGGTRYVEILKAHWNVISPDFRLQRTEFLSGGTITINQHVVPQTSETTEGSPQGNLAAFSTTGSSGTHIGFSKSFVEHGFVIGFCRARADVTYQQGLHRMWSRRTRWDGFWPKLQELGEQATLNKEIYAQGRDVVDVDGQIIDDLPFNYQERYADYRYRPSEIKGQFRSTYAESLDVWHLAEEFSSLPGFNGTFIQGNTPIERVLTVTEGYPHLKADFFFNYKHARAIVTYGVPATLGRF